MGFPNPWLRAFLGPYFGPDPRLTRALTWETPAGPRGYWQWSWAQRFDLYAAVKRSESPFGFSLSSWLLSRLLPRRRIAISDPPNNIADPSDDQAPTTVLAEGDAWSLYVATVAHSITMASGRRRLPWSLDTYTEEQLAQLFDSRSMFQWNSVYGGYHISLFTHGAAVPAPPALIQEFLDAEDIVGEDHRATIVNLLDWCRRNLYHYSTPLGVGKTKVMESTWGYRGVPPVSRIIEGTTNTVGEIPLFRHWTAGCWGTVAFLRSVLRAVNIPAALLRGGEHAVPHFMTEDLYLSHGDDPYHSIWRDDPVGMPTDELPVDGATFEEWFGPSVPSEDQERNVGRRVADLLIRHLPPSVLRIHCDDLASGAPRAEGGIFHLFEKKYTVAELEVMGLWERLDMAVAEAGGCDSIPA